MLLPALTCLHNVCTLSIYLSLSHCTLNAAAALIKPNVIQNTQLQPVVVEMTILHRNTHASRKVSMISALSAQIMLARCARQGHAPAHPSDLTPLVVRESHTRSPQHQLQELLIHIAALPLVYRCVTLRWECTETAGLGHLIPSPDDQTTIRLACGRSFHIKWPRLLSVSDEPTCEQTTDLSCAPLLYMYVPGRW